MRIIKVHGGWIIANEDRHAHFNSKRAAQVCLDLIEKNWMPTNRYYTQAAKRLLSAEDFGKLKVKRMKPPYINKRGI